MGEEYLSKIRPKGRIEFSNGRLGLGTSVLLLLLLEFGSSSAYSLRIVLSLSPRNFTVWVFHEMLTIHFSRRQSDTYFRKNIYIHVGDRYGKLENDCFLSCGSSGEGRARRIRTTSRQEGG